jgi:multidrug efflux pump subunit AcrA (membrane-fusion protein)
MRKGALCVIGIFSLGLLSFGCFAAVPVTDMVIKKLTPVDVYFVGKTKPLDEVTLGFDIAGKIEKTMKVGDVVYSPIYNNQGKELRKGTVVASLYKQRQAFELNAAEMNVKIAKYDFKQSLDDYNRNQLMIKKNAISRKIFEDSKIVAMKAKMTLDNAENSLAQAKYNLASTEIIAPFTGIVSKVLKGKNLGTGDDGEVLEVIRMNPMIVEIPFAHELIDKLGKEDVVKVYPPGIDKPVPTWVEYSSFGIQSLDVYVPNKIISENDLTAAQKKMPKVYGVFPVMPIVNATNKALLGSELEKNNGEIPLAVPVESLHRDSTGAYVYLAINQKCFSLTQGIDKEFTVKKVYVKLGDIKRHFNIGNRSGVEVTS